MEVESAAGRGSVPSSSAASRAGPRVAWRLQVALLVEQVDQLHVACGAAVKGVASEPQQPQLPRLRAMLADTPSTTQVVLLAEESAVRAGMAWHGKRQRALPQVAPQLRGMHAWHGM